MVYHISIAICSIGFSFAAVLCTYLCSCLLLLFSCSIFYTELVFFCSVDSWYGRWETTGDNCWRW